MFLSVAVEDLYARLPIDYVLFCKVLLKMSLWYQYSIVHNAQSSI